MAPETREGEAKRVQEEGANEIAALEIS